MAKNASESILKALGSSRTALAADMFDPQRVQMFDSRNGKHLGSVRQGTNADLMISMHLDDTTGTIIVEAKPAQQSLF